MRAFLLTALAAPLLAAGAPAAAQASAPGAFTTDEAAWCGAVFARMVEAMRTAEGVPDALRQQSEVGLMIWEYELVASAPGRQEHAERAVLGAIDRLADDMPQGDSAAVANQRGEYLVTRAQGCMERIEAVYTNGAHPIVQRLLAQNEAPASPAGEAKPRPKGLR